MKVGDKYYCVESTSCYGFPNWAHIKGKIYKVIHIQYDANETTGTFQIDTVYLDSEPTTPNKIWGYNYSEFKPKFISESELRKLKLEKLNETASRIKSHN